MQESLALEDKLAEDALNESPTQCLQRMLSIKSVVSTASSFAQRQQSAVGTKAMFREIGTGSIGKVFEHPGTIFVYKMPLSDQPDKLWNNFKMHARVQDSFQTLPYFDGQVEIPRCFWYSNPESEAFWNENLDRFPDTPAFPRKKRHIFCMERIFPLPRPVRHALIGMFCPPAGRETVMQDQANKDCLVRPVLGRIKYGAGGMFISLRNFKLHANQIEDLGLDVNDLCSSMAHALAVLHWHTKIDGMDVEFVLGSSPVEDQKVRSEINMDTLTNLTEFASTYEASTHATVNFTKRVTSLWLIDFDDCQDITMDEAGVELAVKAFLDTLYYCPKPNTGRQFIDKLWVMFSEKYVHLSKIILRDTPGVLHLPQLFIDKIQNQTALRRDSSMTSSQSSGSSKSPGRASPVSGPQNSPSSPGLPSLTTRK